MSEGHFYDFFSSTIIRSKTSKKLTIMIIQLEKFLSDFFPRVPEEETGGKRIFNFGAKIWFSIQTASSFDGRK